MAGFYELERTATFQRSSDGYATFESRFYAAHDATTCYLLQGASVNPYAYVSKQGYGDNDTQYKRVTIQRTSLWFDTSDLVSVNSATLRVKLKQTDNQNFTPEPFYVVEFNPTYPDHAVQADYANFGNTALVLVAWGTDSVPQELSIPIPISLITLGGITKLGIRSKDDIDRSKPSLVSAAIYTSQQLIGLEKGTASPGLDPGEIVGREYWNALTSAWEGMVPSDIPIGHNIGLRVTALTTDVGVRPTLIVT